MGRKDFFKLNWSKIIIALIIIIQFITIYELVIINKNFSSKFESINSHFSLLYERVNRALLCGNGICDQGENPEVCQTDCGQLIGAITCTKDEDCGIDVCVEKDYGHLWIKYSCWEGSCVKESTHVECCDNKDCPNESYCLNFDCTNYCEPRGCCNCVNNELVPDDEYCENYEGYEFNYCTENCQCAV